MLPNLGEMYEASILKILRDGKRDTIIFGTTQVAGWCLKYLRGMGVQVRYFCDTNPNLWGKKFLDRRILSPHELPQYLSECEVVVASEDHLLVARTLDYLGADIPLLAHTHYAPHTLKYAIENEDRVRTVYDFLADDYSKRLLVDLLRLRVTLEGQRYRSLCTQPKYFPPDLFQLTDSEIFVDGGAHNGETLIEFVHATNGKFTQVHAFEPDTRCIAHIERKPFTRKQYGRIRINPCGLGEKDEDLHLKVSESIDSGTSVFDDQGKEVVRVRSLDSYLEGDPITFLKLDVEKHERQTLRGAIRTLQTHRPKLAVCVYHLHDDLWEIPLLVRQMVPEYKIFLRHHSHAENETVMYAMVE